MGRSLRSGEEIAEECCFACKDGGEGLRVCDYKNCLKSYHQQCVNNGDGFPPPGKQFTCGWHICVNCRNISDYQCLCCPFYSVCRNCLGKVKFVKMGKQNKGLCGNCFHLAISIEKNAADPRANIGRKDSDLNGLLFKDYWNVIKDRERLTLVDLQEASGLLDRGLNCTHEDNDGHEQTFPFDSKSKPDNMKTSMKRKRSKKKIYVGWGTEELMEFFSFFGKDTNEPLDEAEVVRVVKEYINQKDLFLGDKKKYFQCDDKLRPLFTRRKVKYNMLHSKLRMHLAANADSEDEDDDGSEEDNGSVMKKKLQTNLESKNAMRVSERNKRCFASLNQHNINLLYLRRSLAITLLSHPDTFEQKVVGCFVRVKHNVRSHLYQKATEPFHLGLVTGIKKSKEKYKVKDNCTDVYLCVAGFLDDVKIPMLSDENIEDDEYNHLIPLVEKGLMKRATVEEFEEKVAAVHADIVNNWINKELRRLEGEIDRANEKGWRKEFDELMEQKKLLSTPDERQRCLAVVPEIIADTEDEKETEVRIAAGNSCLVNRGKRRERASCLVGMEENFKGAADQIAGSLGVLEGESSEGATEKMADTYSSSLFNGESSEVVSKQGAATHGVASEACEALSSGVTPDSVFHSPVYKAQDGSKTQAIDIGKEENSHSKRNKCGNIPVGEVINLDTSDDEDDVQAPECETVHPPGAMNGVDLHAKRPESASHAQGAMNEEVHRGQREPVTVAVSGPPLWHYEDPQGDCQGPFHLIQLREWKKDFFDEGFKVWRTGETKEHAILLTDALKMNL